MAYSRQHYLVAAGLLGTIGCAPIILSHAGGGSSLSGHDPLISWAVLTALLVSLIIANRANSLLGIFAWVAVFELLLGVLQWTFHYHHELTWFVFHFVNATPLLIMLGLIGYQVQLIKNKPDARHCENALSWRLFYLSAGFVLLMAIPGSASFIDMYTLMYVTYMHDWTVMVGVSIVLLMLAITVLHALQTYVFGSQFNALMGRPVSKFMHGFCWAVIALNGIAGLAPSQFLTLF